MSRWLVIAVLGACGGSDDPPASDAPADTPAPTKQGIVAIRESVVAATDMEITTHSAEFRDGANATGRRREGPCTVATGTNAVTVPKVSFGTITFAGQTSMVSISPEIDADYNGEFSQGYLYTSGETIDISSTGASESISASVVFPSMIAVTEPPPGTLNITIDRSVGFTASWTGTSPVRIALGQGGENGVQVSCLYTGVTTATVPAAALSDFTVGNTSEHQIFISVAGDASTKVISGDYEIEVAVLATGFETPIGRAQ